MRIAKDRIENPVLGYVVIAVSLTVGMLAASAFGQNPGTRPLIVGNRHAVQTRQVVQTRLVAPTQQPVQRRWILGVNADATESGYFIRHVEHHSAASSVGLEPGDRLISVNGLQVGQVGNRLVRLSDTLERAGQHDGRVRLLVQNRRNRRLVSLTVTLRRPAQHLGH